MKKKTKVVLSIWSIIVIGVGAFIYSELFGLPWKKAQIANELKQYLEEKYDEKFVLNQAYYNFKNGRYWGEFSPENDQSLEFYAEQGYADYKYVDAYPEEIWVREFQGEIEPIARRIFPDLDGVGTGYVTESIDIVKGPAVPTYRQVNASVSASVSFSRKFQGSEQEWQNILELVQEVQKRSNKADISFHYDEEKDPNDESEVFIPCMSKEGYPVNNIKDVKKACEVIRFETNVN
ncbi:hypothetical protein [Bacillus sp. Hm123]|uniref:YfjL-like protein n=1 Tax=Bacillus sp. Hm123 TaxID=3450745 RepID=UPI003F43679A